MINVIKYIKRHRYITLLIILIIIILRFLYVSYIFNKKYLDINNKSIKFRVMILKLYSVSETKISYIVKYNNDKFVLNIFTEDKANKEYLQYKYGDIVDIFAKFTIPEKLNNPYEFDYKLFLNSNFEVGVLNSKSIKLVEVNKGNVVIRLVNRIKDYLDIKIDEKIYSKKFSNLFKSMIYGNDIYLDSSIEEDFRKCGISHLIAVSGSNVAMVLFILKKLLCKGNKKLNISIYLIIVLIFFIVSNFELTLTRAVLMIGIGVVWKNKNVYYKLLISLILIVIYNPYSVFNVGLVMSYVSLIGIVMFQKQIYSFFDIKFKRLFCIEYIKPKGIKGLVYKIYCILIFPLSFTLSVYILLIPIQIYFFNDFYLVTFLSNIIIFYIENLFSFLGFVLLFVIYIPIVSNVIGNMCYLLLLVISIITKTLPHFSFLKISLITPNIFCIICYYFVIFMYKFNKYIKINIRKKYRKSYMNIVETIKLIFVLYIITSNIYLKYFDNYIIYFNVGQGNMAFIRYNRKNIIVDIGSTSKNTAINVISSFLRAKCIDKIDLVILTHMHEDHINGLFEMTKNKINIDNVAYSLPKEESIEYIELIQFLEKNNITKLMLEENDILSYIDFKIDILSPPKAFKISDKDIANANSLVLNVDIKNKKYLFMGDATKNTEEYFINKYINENNNIEVIQIGHHGSNTSTSTKLLNVFNINNAVISAKKKVYGHPSIETLDRLSKYNINIWLTEKKGAIKFKIK